MRKTTHPRHKAGCRINPVTEFGSIGMQEGFFSAFNMLFFVLASMLLSLRQLVALEWIKGCFVVLFLIGNNDLSYLFLSTLKFAVHFTVCRAH